MEGRRQENEELVGENERLEKRVRALSSAQRKRRRSPQRSSIGKREEVKEEEEEEDLKYDIIKRKAQVLKMILLVIGYFP